MIITDSILNAAHGAMPSFRTRDQARETFKREAGEKYMGFAIEKTERFVNYTRPVIVDNNAKAEEIAFLL